MASQRTLPRATVRTLGPADASALRLDQLRASFSPAVLARAEALLPNVLEVKSFPHGTWFGAVHTGRVWTHEVWIHGTETPDGVRWFSDCSCTRGKQCEHAAATLLKALQSIAPAETAPAPLVMRPRVLDWAHQQRRQKAGAEPPARTPAAKQAEVLFYALRKHGTQGGTTLVLYKGRLDKQGQLADSAQPWNFSQGALLDPPRFVAQDDLAVLQQLRPLAMGQRSGRWTYGIQIDDQALSQLLPALLRTGRVGWEPASGGPAPLAADPVRRLVRLRGTAAR